MQAQEPSAMMTNPNQVWFPHVLQIRQLHEVEPDFNGKIDYPLAVDINSDVRPSHGDMFTHGHITVEVDQVIDERPAKGDWSGEFWKGVHPNRFRCTCRMITKV